MQYIRRITIDDSEHIALTEAIEMYKKFAESKQEAPYIARLWSILSIEEKIREINKKLTINELNGL